MVRSGNVHARLESEAAEMVEKILAKVDSAEGRREAARAVEDVMLGREHQEFADLKLRRGIFALRDAGVPQRDIARLVGISQPEVSRRLSRRELHPGSGNPREVILERQVGAISSAEMIRKLGSMVLTAKAPDEECAYDAAASMRGTAKQLMTAWRDGLITEDEYEAVRSALHRGRARG